MSSGQGLLDAPEEAHGKDHEEELWRKEEGDLESDWVHSRGYLKQSAFLRSAATLSKAQPFLGTCVCTKCLPCKVGF